MRRNYAVWEITLGCNLGCIHCGSRAGSTRPDELSTEEALDLVRQLADVGIDEVTLIGGEAFLRRDWLILAEAITRAGMYCSMTTGGYGLSAQVARKMFQAGIREASVSVDGLEATHDHLRGREGSWKQCFATLANLREAGVSPACNTQINRLTFPELPQLYALLKAAGVKAWQLQMTVPMGNAADHPEILLQPYELLEVFPILARLKQHADRDGIEIQPGNNVGYFGPYDRLLRGSEGVWNAWTGCHAGLNTLGIEADGNIKGCPSLPTSAYRAGNIRQSTLAELLERAPELGFNEGASTEHLWGFCQTCEYADLCRGGCTWTAHVFFGRSGNNPYCHHRALEQARRGIREELALRERAPGAPFDHGRFEIRVTKQPASIPGSRPDGCGSNPA